MGKPKVTKATLRERRVFNPHELAGAKGSVYLEYVGTLPGRMGMGRTPGWRVYRVGYRTDPGGHWTNHGNKVFATDDYPGTAHEARAAALEAAKEWCRERYGITQWARSPFGSWHPAEQYAERIAEIFNDD